MMESCSSEVVIDIKELDKSMKIRLDLQQAACGAFEMNKMMNSTNTHDHHIYEIYRNDHDPEVVSLGPYHHGEQVLQEMERTKWYCLDLILYVNNRRTLDDYLKAIQELLPLTRRYYKDELPLARSSYVDEIMMDSIKFVQMLLIDGCFTLVTILGNEWTSNIENSVLKRDNDNQIRPWLTSFVTNDLFLVHNQIPFFILERIYKLTTDKENSISTTLSDKIAEFVENFLWDYPKSIRSSNRTTNFHHLLHLCHIYLRPNQADFTEDLPPINRHCQLLNQWRGALQYEIAGVEFRKREFDENYPHSLLDVRFSNNVMFVPYLPVDENTASIFKNLITLEQVSPQFGNDVIAYIIFITQVVRDVNDVALFVHRGIIGNHSGIEEDVLNVFKELSEAVDLDLNDNHYLKCICGSLEAYYQSRMKWWRGGWLRHGISTVRNWI